MGKAIEKTQNRFKQALDDCLNNASSIITKDYLDRLEYYEIIDPSFEDLDIDITDCGKFYKLSKLVMDSQEKFLNKLITVVNVISSIDCTLATMIHSNGHKIDYYFGVISKKYKDNTENSLKRREANSAAFKGALLGNLVGSDLDEISREEIERFKNEVLCKEGNCYSSVSGVVALRDDEDKDIKSYVQGIENLVDSLRGKKYAIIMLADPVDTTQIQVIKRGYEMLYTQLSSFAQNVITINESDSFSVSESKMQGISEAISKGIAMTQSRTKSEGSGFGFHANMGVNFIVSGNVGFSSSKNQGVSDSVGRTDTTMQMNQKNSAFTESSSDTKSTGRSLQISSENKTVKSLMEKIDKNLMRLDECDSYGAFDCAAYIIADTRETALTVSSNYNALMRGRDSNVQASHINSWFKPEDTKIIRKYLRSMVHPRFRKDKSDDVIVTASSIVSGDELAIRVGLPKKSISGISVVPMASFGRNIMKSSGNTIALGNLYHMGHALESGDENQKVSIDIESLAMHTFVTGSTGSGKTTVIYSILERLMKEKVKGEFDRNIKFMVIEPAKGEYKNYFSKFPNIKVYGTNYKKTPLLRINPFRFPKEIHVLEHIDRLIEIFNVCWPMYAAMPAILKDAVERAYVVSGWNLDTSECRYQLPNGDYLYPNFSDVLQQINSVMDDSSYSSDSKGDYKGALCTRLKSLTNGLYGQIFTGDEISDEDLFESNIIIDLSRIGSSESKSLIMGILIIKLQEYRMSKDVGGNSPLQHITVIEEAHNVLKRASSEQSAESSNLLEKSVEMLSNSIAEMRSYGEGFIIVDQSPRILDLSVIRNTNTKIILRLPEFGDRELVGKSANLTDDQILELSRLKTFVAAVYQNNWLEPVLCRVETNFKKIESYYYQFSNRIPFDKMKYLEFLLLPIEMREKIALSYIEELLNGLSQLSIPTEDKIAFIKYCQSNKKDEIQRYREQIVYQIFNSDVAFEQCKKGEGEIGQWYQNMVEVLQPNVESLSTIDQQKIVALLTKQRLKLEKSTRMESIFKNLIDFIEV